VKDSLQTSDVAEAALEPPNEPAHIHRALRAYVRNLAEADTPEAVFGALSVFGALFRMPHIDICESHGGDTTGKIRLIYVSPDAPRAVLDALHSHPLYDWARDAQIPLFLGHEESATAFNHRRLFSES
jgi:hypothetical protein